MSIIIHDGKSCPFPSWKATKGEHNPSVMRRNGRVTKALPDPAAPGWIWNHATRGDDIVCYQLYGDISSGCPIDDTMPTTKNPEKPGCMFNLPAAISTQSGQLFKVADVFIPSTVKPMLFDPTYDIADPLGNPIFTVPKPTAGPGVSSAGDLFNVPPRSIPPLFAVAAPMPAAGSLVPMNDEWFIPPDMPTRNGWYEVLIFRFNKEHKEMCWYSADSKIWIRGAENGLSAVGNLIAWRGMVKV